MTEEVCFLNNLLVFARLLRFLGLETSPEQVSDFARIVESLGVARREDFRLAARALFVRRHADQPLFDRAFELFFSIRGQPPRSVIDPTRKPAHRIFRPKQVQHSEIQELRRGRALEDSPDSEPADADKVRTYSPLEILGRKNFEHFTPEELLEARRLIAAMNWELGERKTRRRRSALRGTEIDFTRVFRRNLKYGAELVYLPERQVKLKPRSLVVLADIRGSIERYTRMVLHLLHALSHEMARVEVFTFGTRLTRITTDLKKRSVDAALARVAQHVPDWSGGTRVGDALKAFNFRWARRVLRAGAVVLIISDGWDRGDLELLRDEMARLQRSCFRLIWLNPLLGAPSFEATAQGLQVALPFVDDFLPVHNLVSLQALAAKLSSVQSGRPLRRQKPHVAIPLEESPTPPRLMELPQMGSSDYVRRTMTLRSIDGVPTFKYEKNPDDR
jgi:uncharacterized protein with von Willebrand factor type A (vWA) domain